MFHRNGFSRRNITRKRDKKEQIDRCSKFNLIGIATVGVMRKMIITS
jgi:hypothetical protein